MELNPELLMPTIKQHNSWLVPQQTLEGTACSLTMRIEILQLLTPETRIKMHQPPPNMEIFMYWYSQVTLSPDEDQLYSDQNVAINTYANLKIMR